MARPTGVRLVLAVILLSVTIKIRFVNGRKCVCTSKACLQAGKDTCKTRYSCYTEFILNDEPQGNTTTRGCTETATPVLCENRPRSGSLESNDTSMDHLRVRFEMMPRLKCCDSHDYCNGVIPEPQDPQSQDHRKPASTPSRDPVVGAIPNSPDEPSDPPDRYQDKKPPDSTSTLCRTNGINSSTIQQVKPLHVAALVLTFAALISVFAACYVITSFLRAHPHPATTASSACKCRLSSALSQDRNLDSGLNVRNDLSIKSLQKSAPTNLPAMFA